MGVGDEWLTIWPSAFRNVNPPATRVVASALAFDMPTTS
jgi:hypothetical protein